jgi:radical SAM superfamily enzyme YgiQ (UPF0313 family)
MARALIVMPNFWDPLCPPMGISSLKAYAERAGHQVTVADFNTLSVVGITERAYFDEGRRQFPFWKDWNIERNGAEMFAMHQVLHQKARNRPNYADMVTEVLNLDRRPHDEFRAMLDIEPFEKLLRDLYGSLQQHLDELLDRVKPDVVACTVNNATWPGTVFVTRRAKERLPNVRTAVGGPGPLMGIASRAEEVQTFFDSHDYIDYYVVGEGEEVFVDILEKPDLPPGIIDRQRGMEVQKAKEASLHLEDLPAPSFDGLAINRYLMLSASSSRGCPFECSFCSETVYWKGFRRNTNSGVFNTLDSLAERYNRRSFFICDSLSNHVIDPLSKDIHANSKPYMIDCYLRADEPTTKAENTRRWREGGLFRARMGLESASQRILDAMVKMTNPERIARSLHSLATSGVMTSTLWIVNFPGETDEEFDETIRFIRENSNNIYQADCAVYQYHPEGLAGSEDVTSTMGSDFRFSPEVNELLGVTPYRVGKDYSAADSYRRLEHWVREMRDIGLPNPYRMENWIYAANRWAALGHDSGWTPRESIRPLRAAAG